MDESHWLPGPEPLPRPVPPPDRRPWPLPPRPHVFASLEVNWVKATTKVTDQVAVTSVEQEFYNPNPARLEGTFLFPLPRGAHIDKFAMEIDGRQIEAELLKADKARGIYEEIVRKARDPALLEYAGRDVFKVRIFPIEPNSRKRILVRYTELLKMDNGLASYSLPLSTEKFSSRPVKNVSVKLELRTTRPLKSIYSPTHVVEVKRNGPNQATAGYESGEGHPISDFAIYFAPEKDELGMNLLTHRVTGEDGYFLLLMAPGIDGKQDAVARKDIAFVLDTSGSMAGRKLDQAKKALQFCIENLNEGDRFEILRFSTEVEPLFDRFAEVTAANRKRALDFVEKLKPTGGTAIDEALRKALAMAQERNNPDGRTALIVFLTDGQPTVGVTAEQEIVDNVRKSGSGRTRVFCFGIGTDVNTHLLDKITEETRAVSQYVLPEEDLEVKVSNFYAKIKDPVLANPSLKFTNIRATGLYPSALPDLFRGEQLVLVGRYSGQGDSAVQVEGNLAGTTKKIVHEVRFPSESSENDFIPKLWATRRVGYLLDEIRLHGENSELRDEVTDLARKFGIVTPYTAFLITEDEARRNVTLDRRSLPVLQENNEARKEAERSWSEFRGQRTGDSGVADSLSSMALKSADAPAVAAANSRAAFSRRYGLGPGATAPGAAPSQGRVDVKSKAEVLTQLSSQSRFVGGKNFFLNNNCWVDSAIQKTPSAKRQVIKFGSDEYFELLNQRPEAREWLALGTRVQFLLAGTVYEIEE